MAPDILTWLSLLYLAWFEEISLNLQGGGGRWRGYMCNQPGLGNRDPELYPSSGIYPPLSGPQSDHQ